MNIIVSIEGSMAELDWILPVCAEIKKQAMGTRLSLVFLRFDKNSIIKDNQFMSSVAEKIVDDFWDLSDCLPCFARGVVRAVQKVVGLTKVSLGRKKKTYRKWQMIKYASPASLFEAKKNEKKIDTGDWLKTLWSELKKKVRSKLGFFKKRLVERVATRYLKEFVRVLDSKVLLKQVSPENQPCQDVLVREIRNLGGKTVGYPQSSRFFLSWSSGADKQPCSNDDVILFNFEDEAQEVSKILGRSNGLEVIGVPRYDSDWTKYLIAKARTDQGIRERHSRPIGRTFLVNLQKEYAWIFSWKSFENYLDDILDVLTAYTNAEIILKPHPSQDLDYLSYRIKGYNEAHIKIANSSTLALANEADLIISMPSTSINDALPFGKPVIEYFDYRLVGEYLKSFECRKRNFEWPVYSERTGIPSSIYREIGLVEGADNIEQLRKRVSSLLEAEDWEGTRVWRQLFPSGAGVKAARVILDLYSQV